MKKCVINNIKTLVFVEILLFYMTVIHNCYVVDKMSRLFNSGKAFELFKIFAVIWTIFTPVIILFVCFLFGRYCLNDTRQKSLNILSSIIVILITVIPLFIFKWVFPSAIEEHNYFLFTLTVSVTGICPFKIFQNEFFQSGIFYGIFYFITYIIIELGLLVKIKKDRS